VQEVVGPVDGVDHPGPPAAARHGRALLADDAVVGPAALELFEHVGLGRVVRCGDDVGNGRFLPAFEPGLPHEQGQGPGLAHQGFGELVVVQGGVEFSGAVPAEPVLS
jgi:hypothetical protein